MNITVTVEELRAHEKAIKKWHIEFMQEVVKSMEVSADCRGYSSLKVAVTGAMIKKMIEWEKAHPFPKLIPSV